MHAELYSRISPRAITQPITGMVSITHGPRTCFANSADANSFDPASGMPVVTTPLGRNVKTKLSTGTSGSVASIRSRSTAVNCTTVVNDGDPSLAAVGSILHPLRAFQALMWVRVHLDTSALGTVRRVECRTLESMVDPGIHVGGRQEFE